MTTIDWVLVCIWLAISILNTAALVPLFVLVVNLIAFDLLDTGFSVNVTTSIAYFSLAPINIRISSSVRYALMAFGMVYLIGAVDDLLYSQFAISTVYYPSMPYIVIALNAYIAVLLMRDRRRSHAGKISALGRSLHRLFHGV